MESGRLNTLLSRADWAGAAALLAPVATQDGAHPSLIYNYGKVLMEMGCPKAAAQTLRRAVAAAPRHDAAWFELGRAALAHEDFTTALDAFASAWTLVPGDADARRNLGRVALRLGRHDVAWKAWSGFPSDPEAALALYRIATETGASQAPAMRAALLAHHPDRAAVIKALVRVSKGAVPLNLRCRA